MSYSCYRPTSHFIAPHSWSNDPCGAVYVPESQEYLLCYQWNPGTTEGGNCAWGMAKSKDLAIWQDCMPAIWNGSSYDSAGVFSGSIVSRLVDGKRILYLFYTSVSAVPIHWSKPYIQGCETQSVAISTDLGNTWVRHGSNPLMEAPPKPALTTGWRDPFVSPSMALSDLLGLDHGTDYMMISSGERNHGPQLHLYKSHNLKSWDYVSAVVDVRLRDIITSRSTMNWGINFECASFFTMGQTDYIIIGVEETEESTHHNGHYVLWLSGKFVLNDRGLPTFRIESHNMLDHGILYAAHLFRDSQNRLLQLGWADEAAKKHVVQGQGWAGCLGHPRELTEVVRPLDSHAASWPEWHVDEVSGTMSTLGIRPAPQVDTLRAGASVSGRAALPSFNHLRSQNYEIKAKFSSLAGTEKFVFNVLQSPDSTEVTKLIFDLERQEVVVDRSKTSLKQLGINSPDSGSLKLLPGEDLNVRIFVDVSIIEIYANDRFALTSRVYPSLEASTMASHDFGDFDEKNVAFEYWEGLRNAWPDRESGCGILPELLPRAGVEQSEKMIPVSEMHIEMAAAS
ncbi:hypothetical protein QQS21_006292 [Conoideocrella luteorostrata]|uniref:Uncharacterized protein n=1 Tax=Conoideocrella luteorostrata TaxID=1105319 RepID=A0AAJ0CMU2_9HYPO|nr:hypothetical protein QQS21_006292 [Conoideocrella luteorostrata]